MIYYIAKYHHVLLENKPLNVQSRTFISLKTGNAQAVVGKVWWTVAEGQTSLHL